MRFTLTYSGPVKSSGNNAKPYNKHELRLAFHEQLSVLWKVNPILSEFSKIKSPTLESAITTDFAAMVNEGLVGSGVPVSEKYPYSKLLTDRHEKHNVKWYPLVTVESNLVCELSVLMLRPNDNRSIIRDGDIDGRVKTILDSLSIPKSGDVLSKFKPQNGYFYTLLSDDSLISKVTVDTDELLQLDMGDSQAQLIIEVNTRRRNESYIHL